MTRSVSASILVLFAHGNKLDHGTFYLFLSSPCENKWRLNAEHTLMDDAVHRKRRERRTSSCVMHDGHSFLFFCPRQWKIFSLNHKQYIICADERTLTLFICTFTFFLSIHSQMLAKSHVNIFWMTFLPFFVLLLL